MLMAVELPDNFVIADLGKIEEIDLVPGLQWRTFAVHGIEVPVDFRP